MLGSGEHKLVCGQHKCIKVYLTTVLAKDIMLEKAASNITELYKQTFFFVTAVTSGIRYFLSNAKY